MRRFIVFSAVITMVVAMAVPALAQSALEEIAPIGGGREGDVGGDREGDVGGREITLPRGGAEQIAGAPGDAVASVGQPDTQVAGRQLAATGLNLTWGVVLAGLLLLSGTALLLATRRSRMRALQAS